MINNSPLPKIVPPQLASRESKGLQDYWDVYELHRTEIDIELLRMLMSVPQIKALLQGVDYLASPEQHVNRERQREAIYHNNWQPFLLSLWQQGQMYAHTDVGFSTWFELVSHYRKLMRPHLLEAYGDTPERLLAAMDGADIFVEVMLTTIGESYLAAKEDLINQQTQTLRESEMRYRYLFESAGVAIWEEDFSDVKAALDDLRSKGVRDFQGYFSEHPEVVHQILGLMKVMRVNQQSLHIFGASSKKELVTSLDRLFLPESLPGIADELAALAESRQFVQGEVTIKNLQGERRVLLVIIHFIHDHLESTLVSMMDITEQKKAEEEIQRFNEDLETRVIDRTQRLEQEIEERKQAETRFRGLLESAPDSIVVVDGNGKIVLVNTQFQNTFGYSSEEILGQSVEHLIPERYRHNHIRFRGKYLDQPRSRPMGIGLDLHGLRKEGSEFPVEISLSPLETREGILVTASIRDITRRKEAEDKINMLHNELQQRAIQLEATNKELEAFSYSVSHDLRAPLRTIDGFSLAVLEDYGNQLPEEGHNYLMRIRTAAQRMAQLIDDLLNLSRVSRATLNLEKTNLNLPAQQIMDELQRLEPDRKVEVSIAPELAVRCDPRLMKIVLDNLLGNAWKFTSKQKVARIEFGSQDDPTRGRIFFVRDNGAGFEMAYVNKLFGAFQRLHTTSEFPGIGIGLAIVQRIINKHGGQVWAEGAVDQGATFYFTLKE